MREHTHAALFSYSAYIYTHTHLYRHTQEEVNPAAQ